MIGPVVQLLRGMIDDSERDFHRIQNIIQSLPSNSHLRHTLRDVQHAELLRLNMLRTALTEVAESRA